MLSDTACIGRYEYPIRCIAFTLVVDKFIRKRLRLDHVIEVADDAEEERMLRHLSPVNVNMDNQVRYCYCQFC